MIGQPRVLRFNWNSSVVKERMRLLERFVSVQVHHQRIYVRNLFGWPMLWKNKGKKEEEKKRLAETGYGFLADMKEYRFNGGKKFEAQQELLPKDDSKKFLAVSGRSLNDCAVKLPLPQTSLVLLYIKELGQKMCEKYKVPFEAEFGNQVSIVELLLLDRKTFSIFQTTIEKNLCNRVPNHLQDTFLVLSGQVVRDLRASLKLHNGIVGYAYLLDNEGHIRWHAHATPTKAEINAMISCTHKLTTDLS